MQAQRAEQQDSIDSQELRILSTLAETGSLTATAQALGLTQPAVSQRIKRLELRLAVPLIERCGRGIRLTPAGQVLAVHGARVTAEIDKALAVISDLRGDRAGVLRLVGFPSASATIVPALMQQMRQEAPDVALQYREAEPPGAAELLREGEVDCALVFDYEGAGEWPAGSVYTPLWQEDVTLVVSAECGSYQDGQSVSLADFAGENWIAGCEKCRGHLLTAAAGAGFEPQIIQETDNMPALLAMVAVGGAVGLVPQIALAAARQLPEGVRVLRLEPANTRTIGLLALSTVSESPQLRLAKRLLARLEGSSWGLEHLPKNQA